MTDFDLWERPEEADPTPDEIAVDVARDYCETCGKFTDGETCPACGDEEES